MENRSLVFNTAIEHEATLLKDKLEAEGIHALILNQQDSMYKIFGLFEIYVRNEDLEKAKQIVERNTQ
ncbi:DUF2007 domain-containing protein [Paracrocinitomix mangrovi]|uniref:putative signal transducing protein n=1 Tax=Paracrocinitomix mangrovi TaxID=2862509 RepID=UPI001C8D335D|nr:DUF2007 domain-containing protein [Paracrocinitomix mangrovi]UKN01691.1 DUF2007 domain-containing protein [Paracrocinitomix mangrovi]